MDERPFTLVELAAEAASEARAREDRIHRDRTADSTTKKNAWRKARAMREIAQLLCEAAARNPQAAGLLI